MSKLNLKRAPRISVPLSTGDELAMRPLNALDVSELVTRFDLETVELTGKIVTHVQSGKPIEQLFSDAAIYVDLIHVIPDLCANAICLVSGGDDEDLEAIRELPAEDFALLVAKLVSHSLERIGGLGNLLSLATEAARKAREAFEAELQKRQGINSSSPSGAKSPSSKAKATSGPKPTA